MKHYLFHLLSASKLVFGDRRYLFWFLVVAFVMFWLLLYIPIRTIPGNDLAFQISILTPKDWFLFTILPILTALSIVMNVYILKNRGSAQDGVAMVGQGGTGFFSGLIASVLGTATCASCVASIFGFLGVGGVLFLLQYRTYITVGAIILMLISLHLTSKRVLNACESCRIGGYSKIWHST
ncbi:hypothetical protein HYT18_03290 [Candidatus Microgenomates bacterium]|nr:hypothetical protein [Candidatus Microgenomates bacterium]